MFVVNVVCCQVEVSASVVEGSPTDCGASLSVIYRPQDGGGHSPRWAAVPREKKNIFAFLC
jgi:hypothetical protein